MRLFNGKAWNELTKDDLETLKVNGIVESDEHDYKGVLPWDAKDNKPWVPKFLPDIAAFSNHRGGFIFYGISEKEGLPNEISGVDSVLSLDDIRLKFAAQAENGLSPRIAGLDAHTIPIADNQRVVILRIPASYAKPHMVTYDHGTHFYTREHGKNRKMDIREIRNAFVDSEILANRIKQIRDDTVQRVEAHRYHRLHFSLPTLILNFVPYGFSDPVNRQSVAAISSHIHPNDDLFANFGPFAKVVLRNRNPNIDGLLFIKEQGEDGATIHDSAPAKAYVQIYKDGRVEEATQFVSTGGWVSDFADNLVTSVQFKMKLMQQIQVDLPIAIMISLVRFNNVHLSSPNQRAVKITNDIIKCPDVLITDYRLAPKDFLRESLDMIWNACGEFGCPKYEVGGNWHSPAIINSQL